MNTAQILQFILGIAASGGLGAGIVAFSNRGKNKAETEQIATNVYKGLNADLLQQLKDTRQEAFQLRLDIKTLNERLSKMEELDEEKDRELKSKNERIIELERRVDELEAELGKHKTVEEVIDIATDTIHAKVDEVRTEIKSNMKQ